jgi:transcriptional regulator with XRE-family HTH domain
VVEVNTMAELFSANREPLAGKAIGMATCVDMRFAEKVNRRLAELGWNDSRLAIEAKVSTSAVGKWTDGESLPRIDLAIRVARALSVSLDYLADDALDEPPPPSEARSVADEMILDLARELGYVQAAKRLRLKQDPPFVVEPPDKSPDAR